MNRNLVLLARFVVALTWLYEGLWLKLYRQNHEELRVVSAVFARSSSSFAPLNLLRGIGCVEVMLAFGVLSGWKPRFLAGVQILLLVTTESVGIAMGKGAIADPAALIVHALPFLFCILFLGQFDNPPKGAGRKTTAGSKKNTAS